MKKRNDEQYIYGNVYIFLINQIFGSFVIYFECYNSVLDVVFVFKGYYFVIKIDGYVYKQ